MGKRVSEVGDESIRELSAYSYRVIYRVTDQNIVILAVVHKRRDFVSPFEDEA